MTELHGTGKHAASSGVSTHRPWLSRRRRESAVHAPTCHVSSHLVCTGKRIHSHVEAVQELELL